MKYYFDGLSDEEVALSRERHGANYIPPPEIESFWEKLKGNFEDPLIKILCAALAITLGLAALGYADWLEGIGIAAAVFLATFVSTYSEFKNEASFQQLQEEASRVLNQVFRNGAVEAVLVAQVVVGDYVLLQSGDKVPADGYLVSGDLGVNQSVLTGEAEAVKKYVRNDKGGGDGGGHKGGDDEDDDGFSNQYRVFRGSVVDEGEAVMVVEQVGLQTFYGKLFDELNNDEDRQSPLQLKLQNLADGISFIGYVGATFIAVSFLFKQFVMDNNYSWTAMVAYASNWQLALKDVVTSLILAIIIIVVAVPEGLPMMIAIVLSLNMRKLLRANVLVRKLLGIETAGALNILFLDKTGTLTKGRFEPQLCLSGACQRYASFEDVPSQLRRLLVLVLRESTSAQMGPHGELVGGNASDRALLQFLDPKVLHVQSAVKVVQEILFNSGRKFSAAEVELPRALARDVPSDAYDARTLHSSLVKGAPEIILDACQSYFDADGEVRALRRSVIDAEIDELSARGLRVVGVAISQEPLDTAAKTLPHNLVLVGIMGILDEVRPESKGAVELCRNAGIQSVMITGDRKETADAIANAVELPYGEQTLSLTSAQLNAMSDDEVLTVLSRLAVISRALPTDKSRLVRLSQQIGKVVGMTGDGVNDSAALKRADVGFAMGSGSEVAKEASDIVILDDNFMSIAQSVLYGRTIFKSIRKFIVFQSTVNLSSSLIVFLGPFLGFDFPLTLIQLLWVNLVMDTFAALAFGGEPALHTYMRDAPIARDASIVSPPMWAAIICDGLYIAFASIVFLTWAPMKELFTRDGVYDQEVFLTAFFCLFIFLTTFNSFNVRTPKLNLFSHLFANMGFVSIEALIFVVQMVFTVLGGKILRTVPLTAHEWSLVIALSSSIIPFDLIRKVCFLPFTLKSKRKVD